LTGPFELTDPEDPMTADLGRRRVIAGTAGLGLATPLLAACGGDGTASDSGDSGGGGPLTSTGDVPVGGGQIISDDEVVVTQPTEGDFKAFTAVCTHQGCIVGKVENGEILCPCHGSAFSATDGSVVNGPATAPLEEVQISVKGNEISLA
jgi:Rieske Fe-S protein